MTICHTVRRLILPLGIIMLSCGVRTPDVIYTNGSIWTGVPDAPREQAIAVRGNTILAVGSNSDLEGLKGRRTRVVDLDGHFVVPGLIDSHTHLMSGGFQLSNVDLRDAADPEEFIARIKAFSGDLSPGRWILDGDWDHEKWGGQLPHRSWIDSVTTDIPVFVTRLDGHMGLANSRALQLAGITAKTPDPPGGLIVRDRNTGAPTGILKDEAMTLIFDVVPEFSEEERDEALERSMDHALSNGVTQVHDMCSWEDLETYARAGERGVLKIRIRAYPWYTNLERLSRYIAEHGTGNDWLQWNGIKAMVDGSLGSRTAWMYNPYEDDPSTVGLIVAGDTAGFREILNDADRAGVQIATHAIGDRANDWIIDLYRDIEKENGLRDRRFRVEHAQHLSEETFDLFASQGIIASMQPYHIIDDGRWAGKRIRPQLLARSYALRSFLDAGVILALGSDWTVAPISPLKGIHAAVTRRTLDGKNPKGWYPEQKISVEEALNGYTIGPAYAAFQEERLGTLEEGKLADFVVLSEDLFEIDPTTIPDTRVLRTVVGGEDQFISP